MKDFTDDRERDDDDDELTYKVNHKTTELVVLENILCASILYHWDMIEDKGQM